MLCVVCARCVKCVVCCLVFVLDCIELYLIVLSCNVLC